MTERAKSAAKEIIAHAREQYGWWEAFRSPDLGRAIFMAAYRADRYDLLNATCPGTRPDIMELARGDCRKRREPYFLVLLRLLLLLAVLYCLLLLVAPAAK